MGLECLDDEAKEGEEIALALRRKLLTSGLRAGSGTPPNGAGSGSPPNGGGGQSVVQDLLQEDTAAAVGEGYSAWRIQQLYTKYQGALRAENALDYTDLIVLPVRLFKMHPDVLNAVRSQWRHILVDEFQDTDTVQYELVRMLQGGPSSPTSLFVVGDPDQSIYSWRGAKREFMIRHFSEDYPSSDTVLLNKNYRSVPAIVSAADAVLCAVRPPELYVKGQAMRADPRALSSVQLMELATGSAEANKVAQEIQELVRGGADAASIAVLYRTHRLSQRLQDALGQRRVPYTVTSGMTFWQRSEIQDAVAYLRLIQDPARKGLDLERIINKPARGLGPAAMRKLVGAAQQQYGDLGLSALLFADCATILPPRQTLQDALLASRGGAPLHLAAGLAAPLESVAGLQGLRLNKPQRENLQSLRNLVVLLRGLAQHGWTVGDIANRCLELSGYRASISQEASDSDDDDDDDGKGVTRSTRTSRSAAQAASAEEDDDDDDSEGRNGRLQDLVNLANAPQEWAADEEDLEQQALEALGQAGGGGSAGANVGLPGISRFIQYAALMTSQDQSSKGGPAVQLMTLHAAKGLEFDWVFIVGLEDGTLPSARADDMEEERRLFYVGITRARLGLWLSYCKERWMYGMEVDALFNAVRVSRFVLELRRAASRSQGSLAVTYRDYCYKTPMPPVPLPRRPRKGPSSASGRMGGSWR